MSNVGTTINMDRMAAHRAQEIIRCSHAKKPTAVDNMVTKTLGVLQENGIYASALFLKSRRKDEKPLADVVMDEILNLLQELGKKLNFIGWEVKPDPAKSNAEEVLKYISDNVVVDLERLLLAKETLEQMLIYARYGAKARNAEEVKS